MSAAAPDWRSLLDRPGILSMDEAGAVTAYNSHVDLGTGIGTALAQIVAEELDVGVDTVRVVLGHSGQVPNQGATIASETIQVTAVPLRRAAAQVRLHLVGLAAQRLAMSATALVTGDGLVRVAEGNRSIGYGDLIAGRHIRLRLEDVGEGQTGRGLPDRRA